MPTGFWHEKVVPPQAERPTRQLMPAESCWLGAIGAHVPRDPLHIQAEAEERKKGEAQTGREYGAPALQEVIGNAKEGPEKRDKAEGC